MAFAFLVPAIIIFVYQTGIQNIYKIIKSQPVFVSFAVFALFAFFISLFGVNPEKSILRIYGLFLYPLLTLLIFSSTATYSRITATLGIGVYLAAIDVLFEGVISSRFGIGKVSQSGQFAILLFLFLGEFFQSTKRYLPSQYISAVTILIFSLLSYWCHNFIISCGLGLVVLTIILLDLYKLYKSKSIESINLLNILAFSLFIVIVNLKRGPWFGICVGASILFYYYRPKLLTSFFCFITVICITLQPVRDRVLDSTKDFFISGGRSEIWEVGKLLSGLMPLGIGFGNSKYLHNFSETIPLELNHFHNNFLNILVELGWVGLGLFIVWLYRLIELPIRAGIKNKNLLLISLGCGFVSWMLAGMVEYNFGDTEVILIVYLLMGLAVRESVVKKNYVPKILTGLPCSSTATIITSASVTITLLIISTPLEASTSTFTVIDVFPSLIVSV